jgi:hypothetical protein
MTPQQERAAYLTRRNFFAKSAVGLGAAALASLLDEKLFAASAGGAPVAGGLPGLPHFAPKAKRVIYLLQNGGPPHLDTFDYKPGLEQLRGQDLPESVLAGKRFSTMTSGQKKKLVLPAFTKFQQHGQSGAWICDFLPKTAEVVDDICIIKSMHTTSVNHAPAISPAANSRAGPAWAHGRPMAWAANPRNCPASS